MHCLFDSRTAHFLLQRDCRLKESAEAVCRTFSSVLTARLLIAPQAGKIEGIETLRELRGMGRTIAVQSIAKLLVQSIAKLLVQSIAKIITVVGSRTTESRPLFLSVEIWLSHQQLGSECKRLFTTVDFDSEQNRSTIAHMGTRDSQRICFVRPVC